MEDADTCSICFEIFTQPKILRCGHTFCFKCLKEYADESSSDQRALVCPLCRTTCKLASGGSLGNILTNYFVPSSKPENVCLNCRKAEVSSFCNTCGLGLCRICFMVHVHTSSTNEDSSDNDNDAREPDLPIHLLLQNVRTKYICKLQTQFVVETPAANDGRHAIYCIRCSRLGGVLVVPCGIPYLLRMDETGKILDRIRTPEQCVAVTELNDFSILGTFPFKCLILRYAFGGWSNFATTPEFFPTDLVGLSNGYILTCGPNQTTSGDIIKTSGRIQIYSSNGNPIKRLDKLSDGASFIFPHICAYDKKSKTIAIADQESHTVTILTEDGNFHTIYKGGSDLILPFPLPGLENPILFHPYGLCYHPNGNFVVSSPDGILHFLNQKGKLRFVAVTDCEDGFGRDVTIDKNGTIWCTDSQLNGTIKTFKAIKYSNDFSNNITVNSSS